MTAAAAAVRSAHAVPAPLAPREQPSPSPSPRAAPVTQPPAGEPTPRDPTTGEPSTVAPVPPAVTAPRAPSASPSVGRVTPPRRARAEIARAPVPDSGLTRLAAYLTIVKGTPRVRRTYVQAAAALVAASSSIETANAELRVSLQVSGVSANGATSWVSLFGSGRLRDPVVVNVQSKIHQYARGLDGLARAGHSLQCSPAHDVGDYAGGEDPVPTPARRTTTPRDISQLTEEEYLDITTSPADAYLPPPPGILDQVAELQRVTVSPQDSVEPDSTLVAGPLPQRLLPSGRLFQGEDLTGEAGSDRVGSPSARSNGGDGGVGPAASSGGGSSFRAATGRRPQGGVVAASAGRQGQTEPAGATAGPSSNFGVLMVESYEPAPPLTPSTEALAFIDSLLAVDTTPARTIRAALRSAVLFITSRAGAVPHKIQSCLGAWWPFVLVREGEGEAPSSDEQWQFGVALPTRLLCSTRRSRQADMEGTAVYAWDRGPSNDSHSSQDDVVASIVLLWDRMPEVHTTLWHTLYAAGSAASRRAAASVSGAGVIGRARPFKKGKTKARTSAAARAAPPDAPELAPRLAAAPASTAGPGATVTAPSVAALVASSAAPAAALPSLSSAGLARARTTAGLPTDTAAAPAISASVDSASATSAATLRPTPAGAPIAAAYGVAN